MQTILTVLLAVLTLVAVGLQRTYARVPLKELKRRARNGNELAKALFAAVNYGHSLRAVLWFLIGVTSAGFFVLVGQTAPLWFALVASGALVWLGFVWLPAARVTFVGEKLAAWCAPVLAKLLLYIHPVIDRIIQLIRRHRPLHVHTGLYDRRDLIDLLEQQLVQPDNRIEQTGLSIALHALTFGDDTITQHMIPRRVVKAVSADEPIGPIIMDELHASGFSRFPVYDGKKDNLVGTLYLRDLVHATHSGTVRKLMKQGVAYIHEDQSLHDALQAILKTHRQLYVVVNSFEEYVGIITIEDILETILGSPIIDEFDQYDDVRAVATRSAKKDHHDHVAKTAETELEPEEAVALPENLEDTTSEASEVIE
jgi:CBS domain containing-hemolysin-like protein